MYICLIFSDRRIPLVVTCGEPPHVYFVPRDHGNCSIVPLLYKPDNVANIYVYHFTYTEPGTVVSMCNDVLKAQEENPIKSYFLKPIRLFDELKYKMICSVMAKKRYVVKECSNKNPHAALFESASDAIRQPKVLSVKAGQGVDCCLIVDEKIETMI